MKRLLAAALLCGSALALHAQNGYTPVTATALKQGGVPIASGTVLMTPVSSLDTTRAVGVPLSIAGGGFEQPASFSATVTAGAIASTLLVPDQCSATSAIDGTSPNYRMDVYNSATKLTSTYIIPASAQAVCGATAFQLDRRHQWLPSG